MHINIEIKPENEVNVVDDVIEMLRQKRATDNCKISSFSRDILKRVHLCACVWHRLGRFVTHGASARSPIGGEIGQPPKQHILEGIE